MKGTDRQSHELEALERKIRKLEKHLEPAHRARNFGPRNKLRNLIDRRVELLAEIESTKNKA